MEVRLVKQISLNSAPVFLINEGAKLEEHPFYKMLSREDQKFISAFNRKSPIKDGHSHLIYFPSAREVLLLGVPEKKKWNHRKAILAMRRAVAVARKEKVKNIAVNLEDFKTSDFRADFGELAEVAATHFEMANFEFVHYKERPKDGWSFVEGVQLISEKSSKSVGKALASGKIIGEEINKARMLSNIPGGDMTPKKLAEAALKSGKEAGFKVKILEEREIRKLKMGGVIGVSKGSNERPKFIVMEYVRGPKTQKPVVLIGKGVTFDTGGLNLKPEQAIYEMHMDMSGGAAVIHIVAALARLKARKNIIGLVPAVENMPSGSSYRPGDLLKTMSGKTIEVLNTDAEGRVILADALTYSKRYEPQLVIDVATLTGAAQTALGQRASALFTKDAKLERKLREIGEHTGDFLWPLPLWEEFEEEIKGTFGDVANVGKTRYGGAITGAVFLWQFIKNHPWVHIDIAPRMTAIESDYLAKGAAGASINLLVHFLKDN